MEMKLLDVLEFLKVSMNVLEILLDMLESWLFDEKNEIQLLDSLDMLGGWDFCDFEQLSNTTGPPPYPVAANRKNT